MTIQHMLELLNIRRTTWDAWAHRGHLRWFYRGRQPNGAFSQQHLVALYVFHKLHDFVECKVAARIMCGWAVIIIDTDIRKMRDRAFEVTHTSGPLHIKMDLHMAAQRILARAGLLPTLQRVGDDGTVPIFESA